MALLPTADATSFTKKKDKGGFLSVIRTTATATTSTAHGFHTATGENGRVEIESEGDLTLAAGDIRSGSGGVLVQSRQGVTRLDPGYNTESGTRVREDFYFVSTRNRDCGTVTTTPVPTTITTFGPQQIGGNGELVIDPGHADIKTWDEKHSGLTVAGIVIIAIIAYYAGEYAAEAFSTAATGETIAMAEAAETTMGLETAAAIKTTAYESAFYAGAPATSTTAAIAPGAGSVIITGGVSAAAGSAATQFMTGEGIDVGDTLRAGVSGAFSVATGAYFGKEYSLLRVGSAAVGGCASAAATGGECGRSALIAGSTAGLAWGADEMRRQMTEQSKAFKGIYEEGEEKNIRNNVSGPGYGGAPKLGGERLNLQKICALGKCTVQADGRVLFEQVPGGKNLEDTIKEVNSSSDFGANQGGIGAMLGTEYMAGSPSDRLVEGYGGPHDWWNNLWGSYETVNDPANLRFIGNAADIAKGSLQYYFLETMNVVDLLLATPFAGAAAFDSNNLYWMLNALPREDKK